MAFEQLSAGIKLAEQIESAGISRLTDFNRCDEETWRVNRDRQHAIERVVAQHALFGCNLDDEVIAQRAIPPFADLELFPLREHQVATARVVLEEKYGIRPDDLVPLITLRQSKEKAGYNASLIVVDARPNGFIYHDYFGTDTADRTEVIFEGQPHSTSKGMDKVTYDELLHYVCRMAYPYPAREFDKDYFTALTAYGEVDGIVAVAAPSSARGNLIASSIRCRFRPSITVASTAETPTLNGEA